MPCWNKEKWQWLTGLNNARLRSCLRIKWQKKPGGTLTKIACYLRKEPGQKCHLFTQGIGFRLSPDHNDWAYWEKKNKQTKKQKPPPPFPAINPTAPHTSHPTHCLSHLLTGTGALWAEVGQLGLRNSHMESQLPFLPLLSPGQVPSSPKEWNPSYLS